MSMWHTVYLFIHPTRQITSINPSFSSMQYLMQNIVNNKHVFSITQIFCKTVIQEVSHGQSEISVYLNICFAFCISSLSQYRDKIPNTCRLSREVFILTPSLGVQFIKARKALQQDHCPLVTSSTVRRQECFSSVLSFPI